MKYFLTRFYLQSYTRTFANNNITLETLKQLTNKSFPQFIKDIGMTDKNDINCLKKGITDMQQRSDIAKQETLKNLSHINTINKYNTKSSCVRGGTQIAKDTTHIMVIKFIDKAKNLPRNLVIFKAPASATFVICGVIVPFAGCLLTFIIEARMLSKKRSHGKISKSEYHSLMKKSGVSCGVSSVVMTVGCLVGHAVLTGVALSVACPIVCCVIGAALGVLASKAFFNKYYDHTVVKLHYQAFKYFDFEIDQIRNKDYFTFRALGYRLRKIALESNKKFEILSKTKEELYYDWTVLCANYSILKAILDTSRRGRKKLIRNVVKYAKNVVKTKYVEDLNNKELSRLRNGSLLTLSLDTSML